MFNFVNRMKISPNYKWWAAAVMAIGTLVTVADTGELNIAMPINWSTECMILANLRLTVLWEYLARA